MPLPDPQLDDRRFQDIVDEAKSLITRYCPEWTDHNLSDPGITLIELFAWMTDLILYRLNRVPEKTYRRLINLMGISLDAPVAARAPVTFRLTAPQPAAVSIARGTEVATVRTGDKQAVTFTTDRDLTLRPPAFQHCLLSSNETDFVDQTEALSATEGQVPIFQPQPLPGDAVYLGFADELSLHSLRLTIDCAPEGFGVDPTDPPLEWQAWCGEHSAWTHCELDLDSTDGLNKPGDVELRLPDNMATRTMAGRAGFWLRLRLVQARPGQPTFSASPVLRSIESWTVGGTTTATHSTVVQSELLGRASGQAGESVALLHPPVLSLAEDEDLEVFEGEDWVRWRRVESFISAEPEDACYTLDRVTGAIEFGPAIRQPNGTERQYGRVPPRGAALRFSRYRHGGGVEGNVGAGTLTVLKSSIPYVSTVVNHRAAFGGLDAETLESVKLRAPQELRTRDRAVTAEDYEFLARKASRRVARVRCIQVQGDGSAGSAPPGTVEVLVLPVLPRERERSLDSLQPPPDLIEEVSTYLDERRLLGTSLVLDGPSYIGVRVEASVIPLEGADPDRVVAAVDAGLREYLDPLVGGSEGGGWPFGRNISLAEVQSLIQRIPGVDFVQDVTLYQIDTETGESRAAGRQVILPGDVLILPYSNSITLAER